MRKCCSSPFSGIVLTTGAFRVLTAFAGLASLAALAVGCGSPDPAKVEAGPDTARAGEPTVRVGVILPRDEMRRIDMVLPAGEYEIAGGGRSETHAFDRETRCRARAGSAGVEFVLVDAAPDSGAGRVLGTGNPVCIMPADAQHAATTKPGGSSVHRSDDGILVRGVIAGRSFHWRRTTEQRLPGTLYYYMDDYMTAVCELPVETYLAGVVTSEMSGDCPAAFLETQAVVARSWVLNLLGHRRRHPDEPFAACNDDHCQRYQGSNGVTAAAVAAVAATRGLVVRNGNGAIANTMYSKSCGGSSADPGSVWREPIPGCEVALDVADRSNSQAPFPVTEANAHRYLTSDWWQAERVFCSPDAVPEADLPSYLGRVDVPGSYFRWQVTYTGNELAALLRRHPEFADLERVLALEPAGRGPSGRLHAVAVHYRTRGADGGAPEANEGRDEIRPGEERRAVIRRIVGQNEIRKLLHESFLYSSAFVVEHEPARDPAVETFTLHGGGWGHGVGLCQIGALGMAIAGYDFEQILAHYYAGVTIDREYD